MNEIKNNECNIKDLRILGRQGGATARLVSGEEVELTSKYALVERRGYVEGELKTVSVIHDYVDIYNQIRTIMRNHILIARRVRRGNKSVLLLTGKGYHRS